MEPDFRINNILRPLGWIYGTLTSLRNRRFDRHPDMSASFPVPVISIGNITVGGTGKTPHTEYIVSLIKDKYPTAVLSRGYGRCTHGYILAQPQSQSSTIGDEPLQIATRFPDIDVAVCEDRATGIRNLLRTRMPRVILLDDAFQHRKVKPSLNILLVNYNRNILSDAMLPAGRLRESASGRSRAHIIIVTKCPQALSAQAMDTLEAQLKVNAAQEVYFSTLEYGSLYALDGNSTPPATDVPVLIVSGIADPTQLEAQVRSRFSSVDMISFPDHHRFTTRDIRLIEQRLESMPDDAVIITTAKDAARMQDIRLSGQLRARIFVLPVKPRMLRSSELFDSTILNHIETFGKPQ